jgi:maltose/moltooligosaccharide transporter
VVADAPASEKIYKAGTLRYTLRGVLVLSLWLLWGDFAFTFFESVFGRFIPLYLKDLQASNALIGIMTGSIAGMVNILFLPNISQWSDNHRSRFGRRIPFLYVVTPVTVAALIAIGYVPEIAAWLHAHVLVRFSPSVSVAAVILPLLCVLVIAFHFFNMVLVNAYNWLLRDVVPQELMARFLSWFRLVGTASSFAFLWWVFPHVIDHRREVFLGVGLFYLAAFLLMCRNVKEGDYAPPPPKAGRPGIVKSFALYFRECLSLPIYRNFFIAYVLAGMATGCAGPFAALFARDTLALDMDTMGKIFAWGSGAAALIYFPTGWLCDRFSPLRVTGCALIGMAVASVLGFLFVDSRQSFLVYNVAVALPVVAWSLGAFASTMRLFPEAKFGQFYSGVNVFSCGALILGNYLIGQFMDLVKSDYRMTFLWSTTLFILAIYPMLLVYRDWKKNGGPNNYAAPLPTTAAL